MQLSRAPSSLHQVAPRALKSCTGSWRWRKRTWSSRQDVLWARSEHGGHVVHGLELVTRGHLTVKEAGKCGPPGGRTRDVVNA